MTDKKAIFWYDLETTGFDGVKNGIHQLAGIFEIDDKVMKKINIKMKVRPEKQVNEGAFTFCGLTSAIMDDYQTAEEGFAELKAAFEEFKGTKFTLAGFNNVWFDNKFLRQLFIDNDARDFAKEYFNGENLDVYVKYKNLPWSEKEDTKNEKLETLADHFGIEIKAHDGLSDIEATRKVYYTVFRKGEEMHDMEFEQGYQEDHQEYHEKVVLKEELEHMDSEIEEEFENPTPEIKQESEIEVSEPTLALSIIPPENSSMTTNIVDYEKQIIDFTSKLKATSMVTDQDFIKGGEVVKIAKKLREQIKVAGMALDNVEVATARGKLKGMDSLLQKLQSSFEKEIKINKEEKKEEFYKEAFKELVDSDKFGIKYHNFHEMLSAKVKGKRTAESMNKEAELLITELNTIIIEKTQRYLEIEKVVENTFSFNSEELSSKMKEAFSDIYIEKGFDDETIKLYLEKEINEVKESRQAALRKEIEQETVIQNKAHAMDRKSPTFALDVTMRVVIKASCKSEAENILQRCLAELNGRVDTFEVK